MIEQRRTKRFEMGLPVEIVRTGAEPVSEAGVTLNISSGGILFAGGKNLEIDSPVEYVVTLTSGASGVVNLRCMGKVLRLEKSPDLRSEAPTAIIAVSLERYEFQRTKNNGHQRSEIA